MSPHLQQADSFGILIFAVIVLFNVVRAFFHNRKQVPPTGQASPRQAPRPVYTPHEEGIPGLEDLMEALGRPAKASPTPPPIPVPALPLPTWSRPVVMAPTSALSPPSLSTPAPSMKVAEAPSQAEGISGGVDMNRIQRSLAKQAAAMEIIHAQLSRPEVVTEYRGEARRRLIVSRLRDAQSVREAILLNEILGPPKALRLVNPIW